MARFCYNCGTKVEEEARFCANCGVKLIDDKPAVNSSNNIAKSRIAAGILGILVGSLGIHNFYLGYTGKGIAQLLMTLLSVGFLAPIAAVWGLVEGILILTGSINMDAKGKPLKD